MTIPIEIEFSKKDKNIPYEGSTAWNSFISIVEGIYQTSLSIEIIEEEILKDRHIISMWIDKDQRSYYEEAIKLINEWIKSKRVFNNVVKILNKKFKSKKDYNDIKDPYLKLKVIITGISIYMLEPKTEQELKEPEIITEDDCESEEELEELEIITEDDCESEEKLKEPEIITEDDCESEEELEELEIITEESIETDKNIQNQYAEIDDHSGKVENLEEENEIPFTTRSLVFELSQEMKEMKEENEKLKKMKGKLKHEIVDVYIQILNNINEIKDLKRINKELNRNINETNDNIESSINIDELNYSLEEVIGSLKDDKNYEVEGEKRENFERFQQQIQQTICEFENREDLIYFLGKFNQLLPCDNHPVVVLDCIDCFLKNEAIIYKIRL